MLFFLVSCFSFFLISKSSLRGRGMNLWREFQLPHLLTSWLMGERKPLINTVWSSTKVLEDVDLNPESIIKQEEQEVCLLDLPDLVLESILERLSPASLCSMAEVCKYLRERCTSDHLWERHMNRKWARLIGDAAQREWLCHIANTQANASIFFNVKNKRPRASSLGLGYVLSLWRILRTEFASASFSELRRSPFPVDSIMALYLALESGRFCFPAQVYNRENGHGFMLSCYDAELSYDSSSDTFKARYPSCGRQTIEENIEWHRLRPPPVDNPAYTLYDSDCLGNLKPGDHIEIQWRRSRDFPYGWWYGVVDHLESCSGNKTHCQCHNSDTVILEFKQYAIGSRWRQTAINRKEHREIGDEADGFYGGIRKLCDDKEIAVWKRLWPTQVLE